MKFRYLPDDAAVPGFPWNITALSQRDVEITIPIPFVTAPGVSLSAACFGHGQYDDYYTAKCISNLLALGYRRLYVDLYWDPPRRMWSFCPVEIPRRSVKESKTSRTTSVSSVPRSHSSSTTATASVESPDSNATPPPLKRQEQVESETTSIQTSLYTSISVSRITLPISVSTATDTTIAILPTTSATKSLDEILYSIGPYTCTETSAIDILNGVLYHFLDLTDTTLAAVLRYVILNLHVASSSLDPTAPANEPEPSSLPGRPDRLGRLFQARYGEFLFTPQVLRGQRRNLKDSWFEARIPYRPQPAYYTRFRQDGDLRTRDGWPSESVMEFQQDYHHRLIVGFGTVDPQIRGYNVTQDSELIFPPDMIDSYAQNCIYNYRQPDLSSTNNSWSTSEIPGALINQLARGNQNKRLPSVTNLVECGVSPVLNETLSDGTAATDIKPYRQVAFSAFWSWAPGEPRVKEDSDDSDDFRCAVLDPSSNGRWHVRDCSETHSVACRTEKQPFKWTISSTSEKYTEAREQCPKNTSFGIPRTALENRYLFETYQRTSSGSSGAGNLPPIWIDFNSMDAATCWVSGANTTCPYEVNPDSSAQIYVPTIAGVIILIVAALLLLVKCGANRRKSRRRRRGSGGWDYEGVPS